jgi:predicted transcriptional regulator of viral defense system
MYHVIIIPLEAIIMTQNIRSLGDIGSELLTQMSRQGKRLFTIEDAANAYEGGRSGLRKLLYTLVKRGWLQRIENGKYLILPFEAGREGEWTEHEFIIASYLVEPYYVGFRSALNYYGYTEQTSRTVFVISTCRKLNPSLEISGVTYRFVYMNQRKFFGVTQLTVNGYSVNMSDREKTIVDCLDRLEYAGGITEVAKAISYGREELDFAKMAEYAVKAGNSAVSKRLGYLLEILEIKSETATGILQEKIGNSYALLDTLASRKGRHVQRWKVIVNIAENDISQWSDRQ